MSFYYYIFVIKLLNLMTINFAQIIINILNKLYSSFYYLFKIKFPNKILIKLFQ